MSHTFKEAKSVFFLGVLLVALGAAGVLYFKPVRPATPKQQVKAPDAMMISLAVALAALSWGSYGPVLHKGQMKMQGSRLRPFLCVGISYFAVAVVAPSLWLMQQPEAGGWTPAAAELGEHQFVINGRSYDGIVWSLAGGAAGAIGALGVIMAFNFGGKPLFVMPLVFGGAPVVNTLTTMFKEHTWSLIKPPFVISLGVVIAGAMMVLIFAPKPAHAPPPPDSPDPPPPDSRSDGATALLGQNP